MQLMLAVVQDEDADLLCKRLNHAGIRLTRINTIGGFLARGNVTVLAGVEEAKADEVVSIIKKTCHTRRRYINPMPAGTEPAHLTLAAPAFPLEVLVGGATVFWFPVRRFVRLGGAQRDETPGGQQAPPAGLPEPAKPTGAPGEQGAQHMDLMLSIVANEDAEPVTRALIAGGYRITRMNTAGGFFRRGNVTLLIGVEEGQVDDVLRIIEANCRKRSEAAPLEAGMPMYGAAVFVLEAARFQRV